MSTVQKFSLSLLVAVVLFSAFALVAFSGLFNYIESNFYDRKVSAEIDRGLAKTAASIEEFHKTNLERYAAVCAGDWIRTIFLRNQSREDITTRTNVFGKLQEDIPSLVIIRFVDPQWRQIHYSTLGSDIRNTTDQSVEYDFFTGGGSADFIARAEGSGEDAYMVVSPVDQAFVYVFRIYDRYNAHTGYGLFYVSLDGLRTYLFRNETLNPGDDIAFVQTKGILLRSNVAARNSEIRETVAAYWDGKTGESPAFQNENGRRYVFFDKPLNGALRIGIFIGDDQFTLSPIMKGILLFSVFLTTFLALFLILSIRQDASLVLAERIKKFQINLLREYLDRKGEIDWQKWRSELEIRRDDVRQELKHGLGKISKGDEEKLDRLVDKSWDEIISVLTSRGAEQKSSVEIEKLEGIVEKVVANLQSLSAPRARPSEIPAPKKAPAPKASAEKSGEDEEAVEELSDEMEEVSAAEELAEDADEAQAIEEIAEADEVEEVQAAEEVESVEELEEPVEEAESAEELEESAEEAELAGAETVEELSEVEEAAEAEEIPAAEELAGAEEIAETVEEAEAAEEIEPAAAVEAAQKEPETADAEEMDDLEEVDDLEEAEALEDEQPNAAELEEGEAVLEETSSHPAIFSENTYASLKAAQQAGTSALASKGLYRLEQLAKAGKLCYFPMDFPEEESPAVPEIEARKKKIASTDMLSGTTRSNWGIDDLFSDLGVDLQQIVEMDTEDLSARDNRDEGFDAQKPGAIMSPDGFFRYDLFLRGFRADDTGITKSLMAISRSFPSSFFSALLSVEGQMLSMKYQIGLLDRTAKKFKLPLFSQITEGIQDTGKAIVAQWPIKRIMEFKDLIPATDLTSEFFPLFVPVVWRQNKSYLLMCVSELPTADQLLDTLKGIQAKRSSFSF
ncbi:MAG: hypothetical protein LBQ57_00990 [Spirochaetales bacterium]|jgi:TM2 domain-containing membrane protein YozV|nr:hypothetical protein [Spirochaetales bacterium]